MKNLPALILATCRATACTSEAATIRKRIVSLSLLSAAAVALSAGQLVADPLPPTSFPAGTTQYQILFETANDLQATSKDYSTYQSFARSQVTPALAALEPAADWNIIASPVLGPFNPAPSAPSVAGIPVYTTTGQLLTDSGLYSGVPLDTTPNITQNGVVGASCVAERRTHYPERHVRFSGCLHRYTRRSWCINRRGLRQQLRDQRVVAV